jgi:hypothetical protein
MKNIELNLSGPQTFTVAKLPQETIELELDNDELLMLAMQAHEKDITLNQHINNILRQVVELNQDSYKTAGFDVY